MNKEKMVAGIKAMDAVARQRLKQNAFRLLQDPVHGDKAKMTLEALDEFESSLSHHDRIVAAFQIDPIKDGERRAIAALINNPGHTSEQLSKDAGWSGNKWHMTFGEACKAREANLWPAVYVPERDGYFYSGILADFDDNTRGFRLKPEAEAAFRTLGLG